MLMNETLETIYGRASCRAFTDQPVSEEESEALLRAAISAPTAMNRQPLRIIRVTDKEDLSLLESLNARVLGKPEAHPFYGAPAVILITADGSDPAAVQDGSLAAMAVLLAASSLSLGACWIHRAPEELAFPEASALRAKWGLTEGMIGIANIIVGHPAKRERPKTHAAASLIRD